MKLLIDAQLPVQLAVYLRWRGHQSQHVTDLAITDANDVEVWRRAGLDDWVLVSKDEDFVFLANRPGDSGRLIWVRLGNCRNSALIEAFDRIHDELIHAIQTGQRIVEVR